MSTTHRHPYADHPLQAASQRARCDRNASLDALHVLEAVLSEPAPNRADRWLARVRTALDALQTTLDTQGDNDHETDSLLSEIRTEQPRLVPRIDGLRCEQHSLTEATVSLARELTGSAQGELIDPGDVRDRLAELARRIRHHRAQEADLVYEAVNIDLGGGD